MDVAFRLTDELGAESTLGTQTEANVSDRPERSFL